MAESAIMHPFDDTSGFPALLVEQSETEATVSVPDFKNRRIITGSNTLGAKSSKLKGQNSANIE
jgi:hypothetical protein